MHAHSQARVRSGKTAPLMPLAGRWSSPAAAVVMAPLPPALHDFRLTAPERDRGSLDGDDILAIMADPRIQLATIARAMAPAG